MPGYRKNWLWRSDSLWFDRWVHVMYLQPEYVEIITWNDFGESHHIGPLRANAYVAFDSTHGNAPFNYALDRPHDGWRTFPAFPYRHGEVQYHLLQPRKRRGVVSPKPKLGMRYRGHYGEYGKSAAANLSSCDIGTGQYLLRCVARVICLGFRLHLAGSLWPAPGPLFPVVALACTAEAWPWVVGQATSL